MKIYQTNEIKNISLLGSKGSGKPHVAEAMLFECGVIKRRGSVEAKNTVSDYSLWKRSMDTRFFHGFLC